MKNFSNIVHNGELLMSNPSWKFFIFNFHVECFMSLMVWFGPFLFFSAFFLVFFHLLLLVVDLLRLSITDEKHDGSTNEDNGAPGSSVTETEGIDSVVAIVIFIIVVIIRGSVIVIISILRIRYSVIVIIIVLVV